MDCPPSLLRKKPTVFQTATRPKFALYSTKKKTSPANTPTTSRPISRDRFQPYKNWAGYGRVLLTFPAIFTTRPPVQLSSGGGRVFNRWHARRVCGARTHNTIYLWSNITQMI